MYGVKSDPNSTKAHQISKDSPRLTLQKTNKSHSFLPPALSLLPSPLLQWPAASSLSSCSSSARRRQHARFCREKPRRMVLCGVRGWKTGCRRSPARCGSPAASPPRATRATRCVCLTTRFQCGAEIGWAQGFVLSGW
jgi:hypothetical protein